MGARLLISGVAIGLFGVVCCAGMSPWSTAEATGLHVAAVMPVSHASGRSSPIAARAARVDARRAPMSRVALKANSPSGRLDRAGARKAVPVTRGQELGLRFRPDERESPYGQSAAPPTAADPALYSPELQSQFRPAQKRRKPTYEELQAEALETAPPQPLLAPMLPYPMMAPPPMPALPPAWP